MRMSRDVDCRYFRYAYGALAEEFRGNFKNRFIAKNYCSPILLRVVTVAKRSDIGRKLFDSLGLLPFLRNTTGALM
jgi:hypothetical protein